MGDYRFLDVKAGHYSIGIEEAGFQKWEIAGVALTVRQELRVDARLVVGAVQQQIVVKADDVSAIQTDSPTVSAAFNTEDTTNLPVNTRASFSGTSPAAIFGALPGVQADASGISLQGALPYQVEVTVDGVTAKSATGGNFLGDAFPSTESISEIRADGVLANAEFGDPGQIVVTTKGGTNNFHGTGFWYYQSSAFDAIPYTYPTTTKKASVHGNTFGGSVGGPVTIPHLYNGHDRTFFFGTYEGWRHPAQSTIQEIVPSTLMKQGDFSKYCEPASGGRLRSPGAARSVHRHALPGQQDPLGDQPDRTEYAEAVLSRPEHRRSHRVHRQRCRQLASQRQHLRQFQSVRRPRGSVLRRRPEVPHLGQVHLEEWLQ